MNDVRKVKLFRNGRSQAVRIPKDFEIPGTEAIVRKEDGRLIIEPMRRASLLETLETLESIQESIPDVVDPAPEPVDL